MLGIAWFRRIHSWVFGFNAIFSPQQFQQFDGGKNTTVSASDSCFASLGFCSWFIRFADIRFVPIITWTQQEFWNVFKYIHGRTESIIKYLFPAHRMSCRVCSRFTLSPPLVFICIFIHYIRRYIFIFIQFK